MYVQKKKKRKDETKAMKMNCSGHDQNNEGGTLSNNKLKLLIDTLLLKSLKLGL